MDMFVVVLSVVLALFVYWYSRADLRTRRVRIGSSAVVAVLYSAILITAVRFGEESGAEGVSVGVIMLVVLITIMIICVVFFDVVSVRKARKQT